MDKTLLKFGFAVLRGFPNGENKGHFSEPQHNIELDKNVSKKIAIFGVLWTRIKDSAIVPLDNPTIAKVRNNRGGRKMTKIEKKDKDVYSYLFIPGTNRFRWASVFG